LIIIIGNSYFGPKVAHAINNLNLEKAIYLNTSELIYHKLKFLLLAPFSSVIYSISASIKLGGALKVALFFKKQLVQHFIGSDVTDAIADFKSNKHSSRLMESSRYFTEIDWVSREVEFNLPLTTEIVGLPIITESYFQVSHVNRKSENLTILCYIGRGKEQFYGIEKLIEVSRIARNVDFIVIGSICSEYHNCSPPNIRYLGWVDSPQELMMASDIYLRFTEHDGLPFSVIEALACSKFVIYNHVLPECNYAQTVEEVIEEIALLKLRIDNGQVNKCGRKYSISEYSTVPSSKKIYKKLRDI